MRVGVKDNLSANDRGSHAPQHLSPIEGRVLRLRPRACRVEGPARLRIEDQDVRPTAYCERTRLLQPNDLRRRGRHPMQHPRERHAELVMQNPQRQPQRSLKPRNPVRGTFELDLLLVPRVRRMVSGDAVDRAVKEPLRESPGGPLLPAGAGSSWRWCRSRRWPRRSG